MNQSFRFLSLVMTGFLLTACHQSQLQKTKPEQQIASLLKASRGAEKAMALYSPPGGSYYFNCMKDNEAGIDCQQLFKQMLVVIQQEPDFKNLTLTELTDQTLFTTIAEDYHHRFFNSVEE